MDVSQGTEDTVQGLGSPVPAAQGARAGPEAPSSSDCNARDVDRLASVADKVTSVANKGVSSPSHLAEVANPFARRSRLSRSPPKTMGILQIGKSSPSPSLEEFPPLTPIRDQRTGEVRIVSDTAAEPTVQRIGDGRELEKPLPDSPVAPIGDLKLLGKWEIMQQLQEQQGELISSLRRQLDIVSNSLLKNNPVSVKVALAKALECVDALKYRWHESEEERRVITNIINPGKERETEATRIQESQENQTSTQTTQGKKRMASSHWKRLVERKRRINKGKQGWLT